MAKKTSKRPSKSAMSGMSGAVAALVGKMPPKKMIKEMPMKGKMTMPNMPMKEIKGKAKGKTKKRK